MCMHVRAKQHDPRAWLLHCLARRGHCSGPSRALQVSLLRPLLRALPAAPAASYCTAAQHACSRARTRRVWREEPEHFQLDGRFPVHDAFAQAHRAWAGEHSRALRCLLLLQAACSRPCLRSRPSVAGAHAQALAGCSSLSPLPCTCLVRCRHAVSAGPHTPGRYAQEPAACAAVHSHGPSAAAVSVRLGHAAAAGDSSVLLACSG